MSRDQLRLFGAEPSADRVVGDRSRVTGGGVTAGIDFALALAAELRGEAVARRIQLGIEYDPMPPFDSGSPETAGPEAVRDITERAQERQAARFAASQAAAARLGTLP